MLEYIYFVKCPGCEDEYFDFFNDAKDFALGCLSKKPIITQTEVDRNDFGECTDSCDLGTVWSWEDMMEAEDTPAKSIFTKDDLKRMANDQDPELDDIDNSLGFDSVEDAVDFLVKDEEEAIAGYEKVEDAVEDFDVENKKEILDTLKHIKAEEEEHIEELKTVGERKPVPADMSIQDLVEAMEANEDTVECAGCEELFPKEECFYDKARGWLCGDCEDRLVKCTWCDELYDRSECRKEVDLGWLCDHCQAAIKSRGEPLTFIENDYWDFLDESTDLKEAFNPKEEVEFIYDSLQVTLYGPKRDVDDWDEAEDSVRYSYYKSKEDVAVDIWENFIEEADVKDVEGGFDTLEDDRAWNDFLATHFDDLLDKYYDKLLKYYEDYARKEYEETHALGESIAPRDLVELEYPSLTTTLYGAKRDVDDWDEVEHTDRHVFLVPKIEVATAIWENWITEEDVADVEGGLEALEDDKAWDAFLETHFDSLFEKYSQQILEYFQEEATEDFRERSQEEYGLDRWSAETDSAYDAWRDEKYFGESFSDAKPFLAESDELAESKKLLADCPECGVTESFDHISGICANCGFKI